MTCIPAPPPTLTEESRQQIREARARRKRIDRVVSVASFNGWSAAIVAALSSPFILFDATTALAVIVLAAVAFVEFRGRAMVKQLNERGLMMLVINQSSFGVVIILYACWQLFVTAYGSDPHMEELASIGEMGRQIAEMEHNLALLVYALLIPATIIFQGGMAWFYWRSRKALRAFIAQTPPWVIDVLNAAG